MKKFKIPKAIKIANSYNYLDGYTEPEYTYYKFNKWCYDNCAEYIHFWRNGEGKWKCFKKYLEPGNTLYYEWQNYIKDPESYKNKGTIFITY